MTRSLRSWPRGQQGLEEVIALRVRVDVTGERAVDLDRVQGYLSRVHQRGVTGAEVVEGQHDTELAEAPGNRDGGGQVVQQSVLGDLQRQLAGSEAVALQVVGNPVGETRIADGAR